MSQPLRISVAIYDDDDGSIFKHWALAIEAPEDPHKTMLLQVMGSDGRFRYEPATADVRARPGLIQQVYLTDAAATRLNSIKDVADRVPCVMRSAAGTVRISCWICWMLWRKSRWWMAWMRAIGCAGWGCRGCRRGWRRICLLCFALLFFSFCFS